MAFYGNNQPVDNKHSSFGRNEGNQYKPAGPLYYNPANQTQGTKRKTRIPGGGTHLPF